MKNSNPSYIVLRTLYIVPLYLTLLLASCNDYQAEIDKWTVRNDSLEYSIDSLENYTQRPMQRLHSVVYLPDYEDGFIHAVIPVDGGDPVTLRYAVEPKDLAPVIADPSKLSMAGKEVGSDRTVEAAFDVTAASGDADSGVLTLTLQPNGLFDADTQYAFALLYTDDDGTFSSPYTMIKVYRNTPIEGDASQQDAE
mgnify:CR=1 FL=1